MEEFGEHTKVESMGVGDESNNDDEECIYEGTNRLQESYNSLLEKHREYTRVAKAAIRKMKKAKQDYKSILVQYKVAKCEVEGLNEELTNAYSKIKSKEMKFVKAKGPLVTTPLVENVKVEKMPNVVNQKVLTKSPNPIMANPNAKGKSLPKAQRGPQTQHYCHHWGIQGHTRLNCHKLQVLKNVDLQKPRR